MKFPLRDGYRVCALLGSTVCPHSFLFIVRLVGALSASKDQRSFSSRGVAAAAKSHFLMVEGVCAGGCAGWVGAEVHAVLN